MADLDLLRDINNTLRPPRRRRRPAGHRRGLPRAAAPLRRAGRASAARSSRSCFPRRRRSRPSRSPSGSAARSPQRTFDVETSSEPIRATVSIGVAGFPRDGADANELIHQADLAVYRAQAPGPQPRARRELGAAARCPSSAQRLARRCPGGRRSRRRRSRRPLEREPRHERRHSATARAARAALLLALAARLRALRRRSSAPSGSRPASLGAHLRHERRTRSASLAIVALVGGGPGARARGGRRLDLGQRRRRARRRGALRPACRACARDHDGCGRVERAARRRSTTCSSTSARCRSPRSPPPASSRGLRRRPRPDRLRRRGHRCAGAVTSSSTWACLSCAVGDRGPRALVGASSTSASRGSRRTTSSTASSAA